MAAYHFYFRPVLTFFTLIAFVILISLGRWQLQRLDWKRDLITQTETMSSNPAIEFVDAATLAESNSDNEYVVVSAAGEFVSKNETFVFGAIEGKPGVFVFTPMRLENDEVVFVNRGFIPQDKYKANDFKQPASDTPQEVEGLLRYPEEPRPPASWVVSREKGSDGLWSVRDPRLFAEDQNLKGASPYYIDAFASDGPEWPQGGTTRLTFSNRHLEYALTWFGLAGALIAVWAAMSFRKSNNFTK